MNIDDAKAASEIAKNTSDAVKSFHEIIQSILQPKGVDLAIIEGHKKIIETYVARTDVDEFSKIAFLSGYKKMVKEFRNCASVANIASSFVSDDAKPKDVEEDWFTFFFDKVRLVSDEGLQNMWGQILAGEVNKPGKYQRSLLHTLSIMSASQAELFCNLAKFCMYEYKGDIVHPLIFMSTNAQVYEKLNITSNGLLDLEYLGLIQCDFKDEFVFLKKKVLRYGNNIIEIYGDPQNDKKINAGNVRFTYNGRALFEIVDGDYKRYRSELLDFAITKFQRRNCEVILQSYGKKWTVDKIF